MKRYDSLRWILLAAGVVAILGLTSMNVYSLYELHDSTIKADRQPKKLQVAEFADKIRYRFFKPFWGLSSTSIDRLESHFRASGQFTKPIENRVQQAAADSIFSGIYFIPANSDQCRNHAPVLQYSAQKAQLMPQKHYPETVCDGMGIARTQMKALVDDYNYNNKVIFDTNRSITIAFVNPSEHTIFGYLVMPIDQQYLTNHFLPNALQEQFGKARKSGMNVWLRDWTNNNIIAASNPDVSYNHNNIQFKQRFPDFFDNWKLEVSFTNSPTVEASNASLLKNLIVLGAAVLLLLGALVFMFISAQKERALAERQAGFLANVTHELKTPLAVMQAAGENLSDGRVKDQDRLKNYGTHIYNEAVRLRKMIEKLLDVAKADAEQSLIEPTPEHLDQLVEQYLSKQKAFIEQQGFALETEVADYLPMVKIDADSFDVIISNIVENAIKYSKEEKYIGIFLGTDENQTQVKLTIEDHGVGMSRKVTSHIFDKFYRAEEALTAQTKGHGLGLSIVKNLVKLNGGSITASSEVGKGSVFEITFPVLVNATQSRKTGAANRTNLQSTTSLTPQTKNYGS